MHTSTTKVDPTGERVTPRVTVLRGVAIAFACSLGLVAFPGTGGAGATTTVPNGQRVFGQSVVEPVYDAQHPGVIGFISTPAHAHVEADQRATSPLFLPVYPAGSTVGPLVCPHTPAERCPDHGPGIAGLAQAMVPSVYGQGVIGHDHLMDFRGAGDFGVVLEPTVVLFTTTAAAQEHLLTRSAIEAAIARGDAVAVPLPDATLHAQLVATRVWRNATPVS